MQGLDGDPVGRHAGEISGGVRGHHFRQQTVIGDRFVVHRLSKRIEVAGRLIGATGPFIDVADAVPVCIGRAIASAHTEGVHLVSIAVAVAVGNVRTATVVDGTGAIAHPADIQVAHAVVHVITDAVPIGIRRAGPTAIANGVELVSVAVAIARRNVITATVPSRTGAIANAAFVQLTNAIVHVVANAIRIPICATVTIAHPNRVRRAHAIVHVVADSIGVGIRRAASTAHAEGVELIAITITVSCGNAGATTFLDRTGTIADPTSIKGSDAIVHVVTNAIGIGVRHAIAVADSQSVIRSDAVVDLVADLVGINIVEAVAITIEVGLRVGAVVGATEVAGVVEGQGGGCGHSARREVLDIERATNVAVGGQLGEQHASIRIGGAVGISIVDEPQTADQIVDDQILSGLKRGGPILVG